MILVCPHCRVALQRAEDSLTCSACARVYPLHDGIADFAEGRYYDVFHDGITLNDEHLAGLQQEVSGAIARISDFYRPLLEQRSAGRRRDEVTVLDSGCGNGMSVDLLGQAGFDAWGHDLSALRKWQWRERDRKERLIVADALSLPFTDRSFDFVLSSGVIEHLGVRETGGDRYSVEVLPERDRVRGDYIRELLRVVRPGGSLFIDCPNGAFPIDFWHGTKAGGARWHSRSEGFLATFGEIERLARHAGPSAAVRALSPHGRLRFEQVGRHWYGRLFALPVSLLLRAMKTVPLLARSPLNPYLVIEIATR